MFFIVDKMAVVDSPILLELRSDLDALKRQNDTVRDEDTTVVNLFKTLESALRHGLLRDSRGNTDYFDVVLSLFEQQNSLGRPRGCTRALPVTLCQAISFVCGVKCLHSSKGRGRLLLRCALNGQWLTHLTEALKNWSDIDGHYQEESLVRSSSNFTDLLSGMPKFRLDLENMAFLDSTWERATFLQHQLVPCKDLGLMVCTIEGHIIVTRVKPYSVAGEDDKVEVGDLLVSVDNVTLFDLSPEFIAKMIKKLGGRLPISVSVVKARGPKNKVYPPLVPILQCAGLDPRQLEDKWSRMEKWKVGRTYSCPTHDLLSQLKLSDAEDSSEEDREVFSSAPKCPKDLLMARTGYPLTYLGSLTIEKA